MMKKFLSLFLAILLAFSAVACNGEGDVTTDTPKETDPTAPDTTAAPETEAPATEPVTEAPTTDAPATEAPVTEAPATEAPVTEAPATEAPKSDEGGCGGFVALGIMACIIPAAVVVCKKKD